MKLGRAVRLHLLAYLVIWSLLAIGAQQPPAAPDYVVIKPVANMYSQPTEDSDVVSQAVYSTNVSVTPAEKSQPIVGWIRVRTPDDYTGWMHDSSLKRLSGSAYASTGSFVRVVQISANIYREPDVTSRAPIVTIPWESRLEVVDNRVNGGERWLKVRLPDGRTGFVQAGDISSDFSPLSIDQMILIAKRFLGITYTWAGTSTFGFDCSGFTQMLVRQRGIIMPRDADQQAAWSGVTAVERKDLQKGDLLFFGGGPDYITHTGMYIGNGEFIHDTTNTHPMVQISKLDDQPWTKLLVAARRVKPEAQASGATQEARTK